MSDAELLRAFIDSRDDLAFGRLVARHAAGLRRVAMLETGNAEAAEDVTQAAFIVLSRRPKPAYRSARRRGSAEAWLHQVARYAAANWRRAEQRRRKREKAVAQPDRVERADPSQPGDLAEAVASALRTLRRRDRRLILLRHVEEKPWSEVAARVGMSPEAARKATDRAMERLSAMLRSHGVAALPATAAIAGSMHLIGTTASAAAMHGPFTGGFGTVAVGELARATISTMSLKSAALWSTLVITSLLAGGAAVTPATLNPDQPAPAAQTEVAQALPSDVQQALERNADALSPVTIRWIVERRAADQRRVARVLGMQQAVADYYFSRQTWTFSLGERGQYFQRIESSEALTVENSYDGEIVYSGRPPVHRAEGLEPGTFTRTDISRVDKSMVHSADVEYLRSAGLLLPSTTGDLENRTPFASLPLHLLANGGRVVAASRTSEGGRQLFRLEIEAPNPDRQRAEQYADLPWDGTGTEERHRERVELIKRARNASPTRTYVFVLDPSIGYAVRSFTELDEGRPIVSGRNDDFEEVDGRGVWLPRTSTADVFSIHVIYPDIQRTRLFQLVINVESIDTNELELKDFQIAYDTPGTLVADRTGPGDGVIYEIPVGATSREDAIERGRVSQFVAKADDALGPNGAQARERPLRLVAYSDGGNHFSSWWMLLLYVALVIGAAGALVHWIRRGRDAKA